MLQGTEAKLQEAFMRCAKSAINPPENTTINATEQNQNLNPAQSHAFASGHNKLPRATIVLVAVKNYLPHICQFPHFTSIIPSVPKC